ncbi:protein-S-isoprenylcysteine O-methyltransferase Ste14 [Pseudorhodoplanes sinuspersici]|nr:protein-S-isoprenylcysteine O-methyltransferase Ste14 [Pseudorhodoplanes sinuspersici]
MIRRPLVCPGLDLGALQTGRKIVLAAFVAVGILLFALAEPSYSLDAFARKAIEWGGLLLIAICIIGRTWSSFYIGGRKGIDLVDTGPYSIMRNPLYSFSIVGAAGIGAQVGSATIAFLCALVAYSVFAVVAQHEERLLLRKHRRQFPTYFRRVPRFVPDISLWRDEETLTIYPHRVYMTFFDALLFLLAVPLAQLCKHLQSEGVLPVLIALP